MNTIVGWILAVLVGAGVIWILLFLMSLWRHTKRKAASAAAPVAPTSVTPVVTPLAAVLPAAPPAAAPTSTVVAAAVPTVVATVAAPTVTPPASNAPLPKQPLLWRTWQWLKVLMAIVLVPAIIALVLWVATWLASETDEGGEGLVASAKEVLTSNLHWLLAAALLVLAGWLIRKWLKGRSTAAPTSTNPTSPTASAGAGAGTTPATPSAADLKALNADKERGFLATCGRALKWLAIKAAWLLLIGAILYGAYYAADKHKWSNGMTLVQTSIAMSPAPAPSPEVWRYTEQEAASGRLIWKTDDVRILERVRGQEPRFMFSVPSPYQGITSHSRYEWSPRLPEGIVENRERNMRLRFVGNFIGDTLFTGSYTADGQTYTFRLEHIR